MRVSLLSASLFPNIAKTPWTSVSVTTYLNCPQSHSYDSTILHSYAKIGLNAKRDNLHLALTGENFQIVLMKSAAFRMEYLL